MVHVIQMHGKNLAFDVESGSLFQIDAVTASLIQARQNEPTDLSVFQQSQIAEAESELAELENEGYLFTIKKMPKVNTYSNEIKSLCLNICHDCNLRCEYCFADEGKYHGARTMMSEEVAHKAIDFLLEHSGTRKNLEVDFFGGEPLLNYGVVTSTVAYAKQRAQQCGKAFQFTLTTNALLLRAENIDFLNREMDNVVISIDGRKHVHDQVRKTLGGKGSFDVALKHAKEFCKLRGNKSYYIRGTFTACNLDFDKDVLFLRDQGFRQISIEPVVLPSGRLAIEPQHLDQIKENYISLAKEYVLSRKQAKKWFHFFHFTVHLKDGPCMKKRLMGCSAGNEYLAIAPNGDIFPCHQFDGDKDYLMGNLLVGSFDDRIKRRFAACNLLTKPKCEACFAKYHCSGGCAANNIHFGGDLDEPYDLTCQLMRTRLACALYVYAEEEQNNVKM